MPYEVENWHALSHEQYSSKYCVLDNYQCVFGSWDRVFPNAGGIGGISPPLAKNLLIPSFPGKIPPTKFLFPSYQRLISPTTEQFSCYNPIKTSFLAVVIAPIPFLF